MMNFGNNLFGNSYTKSKDGKMPWDNLEYFEEVDILSLLPTKKLREIEREFPEPIAGDS